MKTKPSIRIYPIAIIGLILMVISGCKKDQDKSISSNPFNDKTTAVFNTNLVYGTMTDQEGNIYKTITIGTQTWMAENLRTTKYRNGDSIPNITDNYAWPRLTSGAYCNYQHRNNPDSIATYGRLYNAYAASDIRNIAPEGWHVPTDEEFTVLTTFLGGGSVAGGKMKETGTSHWIIQNEGATNESGFTALPAGYRAHSDEIFTDLHFASSYWSNTLIETDFAANHLLYNYSDDCVSSTYYMWGGFSIRLIKD